MNKKTEMIHIRVDKELLKQLQEQANQDKRTLSQFCFLILEQYSVNRYAQTHQANEPEKAVFHLERY